MLDRVVSRRDAATDHASLFHRDAIGNFESHILRHGDILGKSADVPAGNHGAIDFSLASAAPVGARTDFPARSNNSDSDRICNAFL